MRKVFLLLLFLMTGLVKAEPISKLELALEFKNPNTADIGSQVLIVKVKNTGNAPVLLNKLDFFPYNQDDMFNSRKNIQLFIAKRGEDFVKLTHYIHMDLLPPIEAVKSKPGEAMETVKLTPGEETSFHISLRWMDIPDKYLLFPKLFSFCIKCKMLSEPNYLLKPGDYRLKIKLKSVYGAEGMGIYHFSVKRMNFMKKIKLFLTLNPGCFRCIFVCFVILFILLTLIILFSYKSP